VPTAQSPQSTDYYNLLRHLKYKKTATEGSRDLKTQELFMGHILSGSINTYFDKTKVEALRKEYSKLIFTSHENVAIEALDSLQGMAKVLGIDVAKLEESKKKELDRALNDLEKLNIVQEAIKQLLSQVKKISESNATAKTVVDVSSEKSTDLDASAPTDGRSLVEETPKPNESQKVVTPEESKLRETSESEKDEEKPDDGKHHISCNEQNQKEKLFPSAASKEFSHQTQDSGANGKSLSDNGSTEIDSNTQKSTAWAASVAKENPATDPYLNDENTTETERSHGTSTKMASSSSTKGKCSRAPRSAITKPPAENRKSAEAYKGNISKQKRPAINQAANAVKLELESLAAVFYRRKMSAREMKERMAFLIGKVGMTPKEVARETGMSLRTIFRYTPQKLKNPVMVKAGRISGHKKRALNSKKRKISKSGKRKLLIPYNLIAPYLSLGGPECIGKSQKQAIRKEHPNFRRKPMSSLHWQGAP
jgi:transcriptional regulator with XRE-family HTH domain